MKNDQVKQNILDVGLKLWPDISARAIGRELEIAHTNVLYHFGDIDKLRDAVAVEAVRIGNSHVIAQLIITKHRAASGLTDADKAFHMQAASV